RQVRQERLVADDVLLARAPRHSAPPEHVHRDNRRAPPHATVSWWAATGRRAAFPCARRQQSCARNASTVSGVSRRQWAERATRAAASSMFCVCHPSGSSKILSSV